MPQSFPREVGGLRGASGTLELWNSESMVGGPVEGRMYI